MKRRTRSLGTAMCLLTGPALFAEPVGTAFTYQGQLKQNGVPQNGMCDFEFSLWDAEVGGNEIGASPQAFPDVELNDGFFAVSLDFGPGIFDGSGARWLEIQVQCAGPGFTLLTPRIELTPMPYALALPGLYTQENVSSPNVIGGHAGNTVGSRVIGANIGGGGQESEINEITSDFATISGGLSNSAAAPRSTIGGGSANTTSGPDSTVGGGVRNTASGEAAAIGGGSGNLAGGLHATVPGGFSNAAGGDNSFAAGRGAMVRNAAAAGDADGDQGTFVWCDSNGNTGGRCTSSGPDQFIVRASGGMGVGTTDPLSHLHVQGALHLASSTRDISAQTGEAMQIGHWDGTTFTERMRISAGGNVGVATQNPLADLHVAGALHLSSSSRDLTVQTGEALQIGHWDGLTFTERVRVSPAGNVGIGTTNPNHELVVQGDDPAMQIRDDATNNSENAARMELLEFSSGTFDGGAFLWWNGETNKLLLGTKLDGTNTNVLVVDRATSSVGIGTQNPGDYRLAVNGAIRAKEIVVETGWSDFVFEPDYPLRSLPDVESFIRENGHLPEIPSAKDVAKHGVKLGEMDSRLLQKIEELTLHMIEMDKRMKSLEQQNAKLNRTISQAAAAGRSVE